MISNNVYMKFQTMNSKEEVLKFLRKKNLESNFKTWKRDALSLIDYKEKHSKKYSDENTYRNIYAYNVKILIPFEYHKDVQTFVRRFMLNYSKKYLKLLYIFKTVKEGKGIYADICCFTRYVFKKAKREEVKYNRDFYYNKNTKKMCKKDDPNAVLKIKKGDVKLEEDGTPVIELVAVSRKEFRLFVYKRIEQLAEKIKKKLIDTIHELCGVTVKCMIISRITVLDDDISFVKEHKKKRNTEIRMLNKIIRTFYEALQMDGYYDEEELENINFTLVSKADAMIHKEESTYDEVEKYLHNWWNKNMNESEEICTLGIS